MPPKPTQTSLTIPIGPVVLNWFAITREQAQRDMETLISKGFRVAEPKFRVGVLIDPISQAHIIQRIQQGVVEWMNQNPAFQNVRLVKELTPGGDEMFPNHVNLDMKSKFAPHLYRADGGAADAVDFYRGCVVGVGITYRWYQAGQEQGLTLSAESLQFRADGIPLGGGGVSPQVALARLQQIDGAQLPPNFNMPVPSNAPPAAPAQPVYGPPPYGGYNQPQYAPQQYQQPQYAPPPGAYNPPPVYNQPQFQGGL